MSLANRTDSDRLDELLEATEKQTAAINRLAMAVQESASDDKGRSWLGGIRNAARDIRVMVAVFLVIFLLNGCYQNWGVKQSATSARHESQSR